MRTSKIPVRLLILFGIFILVYAAYEVTVNIMQTGLQQVNGGMVQGYVTDTAGKPIASAEIYISNADFKPLVKTVTDPRGYYKTALPLGRTYHLYTGVHNQTSLYNFAYVPQTQSITLKADSAGIVNFKLRPGAAIVLYAYDNNGSLIRNKSFREMTGANDFATSLNNLPRYSSFDAIHDAFSNWQWDQAIPAFVAIPGSAYKFYVNWEIPGFGKVILALDNEGAGYCCTNQSDKLELNFNYEAAKSKLASLKKDYAILVETRYSIPADIVDETIQAESYLKSAEVFLAKKPSPDFKAAVQQLNQSLKWAFWAHEKVNLELAKHDIEKYRKGNASLQVIDADGRPATEVNVSYKQVSSDFLFGANPIGNQGSYNETYATLMKNAGVNHTCITGRWGRIEFQPGLFNWDNIDNFQDLPAQLKEGFKPTGSLTLWLYRSSSVGNDFCPGYLDNQDFQQLSDSVYKYAFAFADRYKGRIDIWEINELNLPWANALDLTIDQRIELAGVFAGAVKDANPKGQIIVNSSALPFEYNLSDYYTFDNLPLPYFIEQLNARKVPFNIIGLEFYYSGITGDNNISTGLDMGLISDLLDQYAQYKLPIYIEELSAPSRQLPGSAWWHTPWSEDTQAEYLTDFYTIAFSKPTMQAINWSWGVSDRDSFMAYGGLLDSELKPKKSYYALQNLISAWKSNGAGLTDKNGLYNFRGFAGDYEIECQGMDGRIFKAAVHIDEQKTQEITITLK